MINLRFDMADRGSILPASPRTRAAPSVRHRRDVQRTPGDVFGVAGMTPNRGKVSNASHKRSGAFRRVAWR
jgi:hypothetical protein